MPYESAPQKRSPLPWILLGCGCFGLFAFLAVVLFCGGATYFTYRALMNHEAVMLTQAYARQNPQIQAIIGGQVGDFPVTGIEALEVQEGTGQDGTAHIRWGFTKQGGGDEPVAEIETRCVQRNGAWRIMEASLYYQNNKTDFTNLPPEGISMAELGTLATGGPTEAPVGGHVGPDDYEPNNTRETAKPLNVPANEQHLSVVNGDDDWYRFNLTAPTRLRVTLAFRHADGDVDVWLEDAQGGGADSSTGTTDTETMNTTELAPGAYLLHVSTSGSGGQSYSLQIGPAPAGQ